MNMKVELRLMVVALLLMSASCAHKDSQYKGAGDTEDKETVIRPRHARGFDVEKKGEITLLDIRDPENREAERFHFALAERSFRGEIPEGYTRIDVPVRSVICMTSLQLSNFLKLGLSDLVVGITSTRHLHDTVMNRRLREGLTHKIGIEGNFDNEVIFALSPDVIFISPFKRGGYDVLRNVGIPLIPHLGYKELTPLGQAEWIKVVGLLTGHSGEANRIFSGIERRYMALKARTDSVKERPRVFTGEMRGGNWYAVGGRSFLAQMFRDAGGKYFLEDNGESGGVTLDYETVYSNASDAMYWRIVNSFDGDFSYEVLKDNDQRYADFAAWKNGGVIYCNMKEVPFYERMPVEPEVVLSDLIHIFHPELLPDHQPVYYHLLRK